MTHSTTIGTDRTAQGVGIILASVLAMAFADAVVKLVSADMTVWQVFIARAVFAVPSVAVIMLISGTSLRLHAPQWVLLRSALLVLTWLVYYASLPVLSLSVAAVAIYTSPILIALLSAAVIGEPVTKRQWGGVLLGFVGVVTILRPGTDAFSWYVLLPLLGAVLYSMAMVLTRSKCRSEAPLTLGLMLHISFLIAGLLGAGAILLVGPAPELQSAAPFLFADWAAMGGREWGLMALIGILSAAFFVGVARAYQIAPPQIIATFDYGYLISAAVWGFVFFAETPDALTVAGMVLITVAGLMAASQSRKP